MIKKGDKVGASEATLLNMLKISPFTYGLVIEQVYDNGTLFDVSVLDITDDDIRARFLQVTCLFFLAAYPHGSLFNSTNCCHSVAVAETGC